MARITTVSGTVYAVSSSGRMAYPLRDPSAGAARNLLWGPEAARAQGLLVDGRLDRNDYAVRGAGPEWREVYEALQAIVEKDRAQSPS